MYLIRNERYTEALAGFSNRESAESCVRELRALANANINHGVWYDGMRCYPADLYVEFVPEWQDNLIGESEDDLW